MPRIELADPDRRLAARLHHLIGKPLQLLAVARVERKRGESVGLRGAEPPRAPSALRGVDGSRGSRWASNTQEVRPEAGAKPTSVLQPRCTIYDKSSSMGEHLNYDSLRADTVRQVAKLMAAAAITAPKSGGALPRRQAPVHRDRDRRRPRHPGEARRLDARLAARNAAKQSGSATPRPPRRSSAVLFVGLADWYPPSTTAAPAATPACAEFMHATKQLRDESDELEFVGPQCNLRDIDLGIAVGSAAKTAAIHSIDAPAKHASPSPPASSA